MRVAMAEHVSGDLGSPKDLHRAGGTEFDVFVEAELGTATEKGCQNLPPPHPLKAEEGSPPGP